MLYLPLLIVILTLSGFCSLSCSIIDSVKEGELNSRLNEARCELRCVAYVQLSKHLLLQPNKVRHISLL